MKRAALFVASKTTPLEALEPARETKLSESERERLRVCYDEMKRTKTIKDLLVQSSTIERVLAGGTLRPRTKALLMESLEAWEAKRPKKARGRPPKKATAKCPKCREPHDGTTVVCEACRLFARAQRAARKSA